MLDYLPVTFSSTMEMFSVSVPLTKSIQTDIHPSSSLPVYDVWENLNALIAVKKHLA